MSPGAELLDPVEAMGRNQFGGLIRVEMPHRSTQAAVRSLVFQNRRAVLRQLFNQWSFAGYVDLLEALARGIELLEKDEQVHVVGTVNLHP